MGAADLLQELAAAGLTVAAEGTQLVIRPGSRLTDSMRAALRVAKPELLALLAGAELAHRAVTPSYAAAPADRPVVTPAPATWLADVRVAAPRCTACRHITRMRTCGDPVAAGLAPGFGIAWPPAGYGATCPAWAAAPEPTSPPPSNAPTDQPAMSEPELVAFVKRQTEFQRRGFGDDDTSRLAELLLRRDRDGDDRRLCLECSNLGASGRCLASASGRARWADRMHDPVPTVLQRCEWFGLRKALR